MATEQELDRATAILKDMVQYGEKYNSIPYDKLCNALQATNTMILDTTENIMNSFERLKKENKNLKTENIDAWLKLLKDRIYMISVLIKYLNNY